MTNRESQQGLHYLTEVQFAMIGRALRDQREGLTDVNQISYWRKFQGKSAKQILMIQPEIVAASSKLLTHVQEEKGKNYPLPKGTRTTDIVSRYTYNLDDMTFVSSGKWDPTLIKKKESRLPPGVTNIHTVFTYKAQQERLKPVGRLSAKLVQTMLDELGKVVIALGKQRTNVWDPLCPTLRSVTLGACATRGCGVTRRLRPSMPVKRLKPRWISSHK
eukprot:2969067-Amphidinium_carterae.3